jgi:hypothetical protein
LPTCCGSWERLESCPAVNDEPTAVTVIEADMNEFRELSTQFHRFLNNDFRHAIEDISYLKGQMKLVLAGLSALLIMMSAIMAGLAIEVLR